MFRKLVLNTVLALTLASCVGIQIQRASSPGAAAEGFLNAWQQGDVERMKVWLERVPPEFEAMHQQHRVGLMVVSSQLALQHVHQPAEGVASATFRAVHVLRGFGAWEQRGVLTLVNLPEGWRVRWSPEVLHPDVHTRGNFSRTRRRPARSPILDARGDTLVTEREVIAVGVDHRRMVSTEPVVEAAVKHLGMNPQRVRALLQAGPTQFLALTELRPERYQQLRPMLAPVRGIVFRRSTARLPVSDGFAVQTLGRVGPITAELLSHLGPQYQAGDIVGLAGLELAHEAQLGGAAAGEVRFLDALGLRVLHRFEGKAPMPLRTTLVPEVQRAAEAALDGVQPAALVAVDIASGAVLAVVSRPSEHSHNRALTGLYPPGSTFKIVTAEALLANGMRAEQQVSCPAEALVGGKAFRNFEKLALGEVPLRLAFAHSCNTTFARLGAQLPPEALIEASRRFGFEADYDVGLPTPKALFPPPLDAADQAASALGQGRLLATPLHMASIAAAAVSGTWRSPHLVSPASVLAQTAVTTAVIPELRALMRAVVTDGSGKAGASMADLIGKTGTAEFGSQTPLRTHAWFVGSHHGIAFAVIVEDGGVGGRVAVPLAVRFAAAL